MTTIKYMRHIEKNQKNRRHKSNHNNNYIKYECTKDSNQKAQIISLEKKKQDLIICAVQQTQFISRHRWLKIKGWKKIYYANSNQKRDDVLILKG